jgi:hypothetical protein
MILVLPVTQAICSSEYEKLQSIVFEGIKSGQISPSKPLIEIDFQESKASYSFGNPLVEGSHFTDSTSFLLLSVALIEGMKEYSLQPGKEFFWKNSISEATAIVDSMVEIGRREDSEENLITLFLTKYQEIDRVFEKQFLTYCHQKGISATPIQHQPGEVYEVIFTSLDGEDMRDSEKCFYCCPLTEFLVQTTIFKREPLYDRVAFGDPAHLIGTYVYKFEAGGKGNPDCTFGVKESKSDRNLTSCE